MFELVGGQPFFDALVDRFYDGVETDPRSAPLYPDDLEPGKRALALFLGQYWGGPPDYSDEKGHPRLRMRHAPFAIDASARDAWLALRCRLRSTSIRGTRSRRRTRSASTSRWPPIGDGQPSDERAIMAG